MMPRWPSWSTPFASTPTRSYRGRAGVTWSATPGSTSCTRSPPSSAFRGAASRATTTTCTPRMRERALELGALEVPTGELVAAHERAARRSRAGAARGGPRDGGATRRGVLVTGASRGIGSAIARAFAANGDLVAVHYGASRAAAEQTLTTLEGDGHVMVQADLRDPEAIRAMVDEAVAALGRIDVLVNNAGVFFPHPIEVVDYEEWQRAWQETVGVNLIGAANVTWCALQHMPAWADHPRIVNVGSRGAFRTEPKQPVLRSNQGRHRRLRPVDRQVTRASGHRRHDDRAGIRRHRHGGRSSGRPGRRRDPRAEPVQPGGHRRRGGCRRAVSRLPRGRGASGSVLDFNGASFLRM